MVELLEREVLLAAREIARRLRRGRRVWVVLEPDGRIVVLLAILALLLAACGSAPSAAGQMSPARATATRTPEQEWLRRLVVSEWHVVEEYGYTSVVGELRNNNGVAVGAGLLITAYDKDGHVVDSTLCWPASVRNVPANSTFPIDCPLTGRPGVERVTLRVEEAQQW